MVALPLELLNKIRESSDTMTVTVVIDRAIRHQKATSDNQQLIGSRRNSMRSRWSGCMDINPSLVEEQRPPVLSHRRPSIDTMFSTSHHDQHNCCHPSLDGTMSLAAQVIVPFPTRKLPGDNSPRLPNRMRVSRRLSAVLHHRFHLSRRHLLPQNHCQITVLDYRNESHP